MSDKYDTAEGRGWKEGDVFEVIKRGMFTKGSIVILDNDDKSCNPFFSLVKGDVTESQASNGKYGEVRSCDHLYNMARIYPPEEVKEPIETITLMGKEYNKQEIEAALADVLPVNE